MKRPTIETLNALEKLSRTIRETQKTSAQLIQAARSKCCEALTEAILLGYALAEAKAIVGEDWPSWLQRHYLELSPQQAEGFIRLATNVCDNDDRIRISLRQACITAGIV